MFGENELQAPFVSAPFPKTAPPAATADPDYFPGVMEPTTNSMFSLPPGCKWKAIFKVFYMEDSAHTDEYADLTTEILNGEKMLLCEDKSWTKEGYLRIAVKWATYIKN